MFLLKIFLFFFGAFFFKNVLVSLFSIPGHPWILRHCAPKPHRLHSSSPSPVSVLDQLPMCNVAPEEFPVILKDPKSLRVPKSFEKLLKASRVFSNREMRSRRCPRESIPTHPSTTFWPMCMGPLERGSLWSWFERKYPTIYSQVQGSNSFCPNISLFVFPP